MNKLWYEIKKLGFMRIDNKCKLCQQSLKNFKDHPLTIHDVIVIVPNVNCDGKITHYHIGRTTVFKIKETKIFKDLERGK